jgi:hypothetical protein
MTSSTIPPADLSEEQWEQMALVQAEVLQVIEGLVAERFASPIVAMGASGAVGDLVGRLHGRDEVPVHFAKMAALTYHAWRPRPPGSSDPEPAGASPSEGERGEMRELQSKAHAWIDSLQVAGIAQNAIVTTLFVTLVERALASGGVEQTVTWLQGLTAVVERDGADLLADLRKRGH